jgi:hypothetical protein
MKVIVKELSNAVDALTQVEDDYQAARKHSFLPESIHQIIADKKHTHIMYIIDEPSGRPIRAITCTSAELETTQKEFEEIVANME